MKRMLAFVIASQLLNLSTSQLLYAQKCVNPHFDAQRLDFRDLGYPGATEIPADSSPITALMLNENNGKVYGATSGKMAHLFVYDARVNKVFPLGSLPETEKGVHHALAQGEDGMVFIGTGLNEIEIPRLTRDTIEGRRAIENQLWMDIQARYKNYAGGHLYAYNPHEHDATVHLPGSKAEVEDLGIPVPHNSIYAMTMDNSGSKIYGISYPDAEFFCVDIFEKKTTRLGKWMEKLAYPGPERSWRGVPRGLCSTVDNKIWSAGDDGLMRGYDPETKQFISTTMRIPGEYWETQAYNAFPVLEQIISSPDGTLMGTTSDGFVFKAIPGEDRLVNLGKPRVERRIRAMTRGQDGRFYMIAGEKDNVCRLFSYQEGEGFQDWGVLGVDRSPYYAKIAYQFDALCTAADGTICIGESDRRAKLFLFVPGGKVMPGVLNPTNPR